MTCNSHSIPKFLSHPSAQTLHVSVTPVRCTIQRSCLSILAHQNQCGQPYQHTDRSHKFRAERNSIFCKLPARRHRLAHNSALPVPLLVCCYHQMQVKHLSSLKCSFAVWRAGHSFDRGSPSLDFGPNSRVGLWGKAPCVAAIWSLYGAKFAIDADHSVGFDAGYHAGLSASCNQSRCIHSKGAKAGSRLV